MCWVIANILTKLIHVLSILVFLVTVKDPAAGAVPAIQLCPSA